jgi:hypothetical protein
VVNAQQFGGFGPVTVAWIPVAVGVTPQSVLLNISAVIVSPSANASVRILNTNPIIVELCGMTTVFRTKLDDAVPSPKN